MYSYKIHLICLGIVTGKTVSLPNTRYVFEGQEGILRCQNRSENDSVFYNNINDAQWYRLFPNSTTHQFGTSGPVFIQRHGLYFHPFVRPEDQGMYYCCKPNGSCSESSNVTIAGQYTSDLQLQSLLLMHVAMHVYIHV